ncbi:MAG: YfhO family protein [Actinomycetota bacterium]
MLANEYVLAVLVLAGLLAVFFSPLVRHDATFSTVRNTMQFVDPWNVDQPSATELYVQSDQAQAFHPAQVFVDESIKEDDQIPLWNPLTFAGHPYLANSGSGLAYPPRVLVTLLFEPSWAHDVYVMLHLFVAGLAMFALMKELGTRFAGALLAAVAWMLSSYVMAWAQLELIGTVAALLPLVVLSVRRWHTRRSWAQLLLGSLALGGLFLGTSAELSLMTFVFVFGYAAGLALHRVVVQREKLDRRARLEVLAGPAVLIAAALAVAAVGVLPFLELSGRVGREPVPYDQLVSPAGRGFFTALPAYFLRTLVPPETPLTLESILAAQVFVGTLTALFAAGALFLRRVGTGLGRTLALVVALFALGTPVTWLGYHVVPGLDSLLGFGRSLYLWDFALAILGGIGLDAALGRLRRMRPTGRGWIHRWLAPERTRRALITIVATGCIAVTAAQLISYGRHANPAFQPRADAALFPTTPAIDAVRAETGTKPGSGRVLAVNSLERRHARLSTLPGATGMALGLNVAGGYEAVLPDDNSVLWRVLAGEPIEDALAHRLDGSAYTVYYPETRTELLGRVGTAAVLGPPDMGEADGWAPEELAARGLALTYSGPDGTVYEVTDAAPRAFVVTEAVGVDSSEEALRRFVEPDFRVRDQVIIEGDPDDRSRARSTGGTARVEWKSDRPNDVGLRVTSDEAGWLVLLDAWDPGWHATVDGHGADIERADFIFRAVRIPAGTSDVTFTYRPTPVVAGAVVSVVSTTAIVAVVAAPPVLRWRRRRERAGPPDGP